ncbi:hypothetical protein G4B88_005745 [Cannabis sativa]|uniref:DUF4283 domain-containing protein n=1 Tax=Cannabis sativa TaxID=3483 RepID=A0A7J6GR56_CANSA|nr:hypothetical protein G4B88_005745 [Cannabis sativa]
MESLATIMNSNLVLSEKEKFVHTLIESDLADGDKYRIMNGEPWHFNKNLIVLHSLSVLLNVTKADLCKVQFWVQTHRLPFLSKSCALAKKIGDWVDDGLDPELPYGPEMIGDKLPNSGYDRYRHDLSKANAYPFLTRLAKKSICSTFSPSLSNKHLALGGQSHPINLTQPESSSKENIVSQSKAILPDFPSPFPSYFTSIPLI